MSVAQIPQAEIDAKNADKPLFVGDNVVRRVATAKWSEGATASGTDRTATGFEAYFGYDGRQNQITKPDDVTTTDTIYFYMIFTGSPANNVIDSFLLMNHNASDIGLLTIQLQIDDNDDGLYSAVTVVSTLSGLTTNKRLADFNFNVNHDRYTDQVHWRIRFLRGGGNYTAGNMPQFGEVVLGRRRQMGFKAREPFVEFNQRISSERFSNDAGSTVDFIKSAGQEVFPRRFQMIDGVAAVSGLNDFTTIKNFWSDTGRGINAFAYCENPFTSPQDYIWCKDRDRTLKISKANFAELNADLTLEEEAPFLANE